MERTDEPQVQGQGRTKGAILISAARFVAMAAQVVSIPLMLKWLGAAQYGSCILVLSVVRYISLIDLGFTDGATLGLLRGFAPGQRTDTGLLWRTSILLALLHGLVGGVLFVLAGSFFGLKGLHARDATLLFLAGACAWLFMSLALANNVYMNARHDFARLAINNVVSSIVGTGMSLSLVWITRSPVAYLLGTMCGPMIAFALGVWHYRGEVLRRSGKLFCLESARGFFGVGIRNYPNRVAGVLSSTADRVVLGGAVSTSLLTHYANCSKIPESLCDLAGSVHTTSQPEISRAYLTDKREFALAIHRNSLIALAVGASFILVPSAFGRPILDIWLKDQAYAGGAFVMLGIGLYKALELYYSPLGASIFATGRPNLMFPFVLWNGLMTLVLSLPMTRWLGIEGLALMNVMIHLCQFVPLALYIRRRVAPELPLRRQLGRASGILGIGLAAALVGFVVTGLPYMLAHAYLSLALMPLLSVGTAAVIFGAGLAETPRKVREMVSRLAIRGGTAN